MSKQHKEYLNCPSFCLYLDLLIKYSMKKILLTIILFLFSLSGVYAEGNNKKVELVWEKIQKVTLNYSNIKKQKTYKQIVSQIDKYKSKSSNEKLNEILLRIEWRVKNQLWINEKGDFLLLPISITHTAINKYFIPSNLVNINDYSKKNNLSLKAENDDIKIKEEIITSLDNFISSCDGSLIISDGYRSYNTQQKLFNKLWGWKKWVANSWYSEHQAGYTVDIKSKNYNCLHSNMYKYGFILSYPKWNKYLNGYSIYEPWHFRYIWEEATEVILYSWMQNSPLEFLDNYSEYKEKYKNKDIFDRTKDFYKTSLQENTYSCEISATSDIISTLKNKNITEDELIKKIDKSWFNETAKYSNWIYIWGNPNNWYVGYINKDGKGNTASQRNLTGYGVYEKPIKLLYKGYGIKTKIINNSHYTKTFWPEQHLQELIKEFTKGNYIQLWWDICTTPEYDDWELKLWDITQEDVDNWKNAKNSCWSFGQDRKTVWYYEEDWKLIKHQGLIWEHNFYLLWYEGNIKKSNKYYSLGYSNRKAYICYKRMVKKMGRNGL